MLERRETRVVSVWLLLMNLCSVKFSCLFAHRHQGRVEVAGPVEDLDSIALRTHDVCTVASFCRTLLGYGYREQLAS